MRLVFADACYFIALLSPRDRLHAQVKTVSEEVGPHNIVTSEMVLLEVLNSLAGHGLAIRTLAGRLVRHLAHSPRALVVPMSNQLFADSLALYEARSDQKWGLVDCSSFLIMKEHRIGEALTADHHFKQAGFVTLLA